MPRLKDYVTEYVRIVEFCINNGKGFHYGDNRYAVDKAYMCKLLEQNPYAKVYEKLILWRSLRWINTGKDRFTSNINIKETDTRRRMMLIDLGVYNGLVPFCQEDIITENKAPSGVKDTEKRHRGEIRKHSVNSPR